MEPAAQAALALYCQMIPGATCAVTLHRASDAADPVAVARWPDGGDPSAMLATLAARAAREGCPVTRTRRVSDDDHRVLTHVAVPLRSAGAACGGVAVEFANAGPSQPSGLVDWMTASAPWLAYAVDQDARHRRLGTVLDLIGLALQLDDFDAAASGCATELATRLGCERVGIGFVRGRQVEITTLSHSARFDERAQLLRDLAEVMEECVDQDVAIVCPEPAGATPRITRSHRKHMEAVGAGGICTVPIARRGEIVGAISFEWPAGSEVGPETLQLCQDVGALLGPVLDVERQRDAPISQRVREFGRAQWRKLREPGHTSSKLAVAVALLCLLPTGFVRVEHRIAAEARLEGRIQRAIVAGIDGYIGAAHARAGDVVRDGQILGLLDQRELLLERQQLSARRDQLRREYREALAQHDRTQLNIIGARVAQADARLRLVEEKLARTRLRAPFDGVVVEGDLSQVLGSPVEKGEVLFQVAPLDGYRIILEVDERDIASVSRGVSGQLALAALPGQPLPLTVERVTPVSVAEDGRNYFRVEAQLDAPDSGLRPGMAGIGKLEVGRRSLLWIWTHDALDWLRLWLWSWWP